MFKRVGDLKIDIDEKTMEEVQEKTLELMELIKEQSKTVDGGSIVKASDGTTYKVGGHYFPEEEVDQDKDSDELGSNNRPKIFGSIKSKNQNTNGYVITTWTRSVDER